METGQVEGLDQVEEKSEQETAPAREPGVEIVVGIPVSGCWRDGKGSLTVIVPEDVGAIQDMVALERVLAANDLRLFSAIDALTVPDGEGRGLWRPIKVWAALDEAQQRAAGIWSRQWARPLRFRVARKENAVLRVTSTRWTETYVEDVAAALGAPLAPVITEPSRDGHGGRMVLALGPTAAPTRVWCDCGSLNGDGAIRVWSECGDERTEHRGAIKSVEGAASAVRDLYERAKTLLAEEVPEFITCIACGKETCRQGESTCDACRAEVTAPPTKACMAPPSAARYPCGACGNKDYDRADTECAACNSGQAEPLAPEVRAAFADVDRSKLTTRSIDAMRLEAVAASIRVEETKESDSYVAPRRTEAPSVPRSEGDPAPPAIKIAPEGMEPMAGGPPQNPPNPPVNSAPDQGGASSGNPGTPPAQAAPASSIIRDVMKQGLVYGDEETGHAFFEVKPNQHNAPSLCARCQKAPVNHNGVLCDACERRTDLEEVSATRDLIMEELREVPAERFLDLEHRVEAKGLGNPPQTVIFARFTDLPPVGQQPDGTLRAPSLVPADGIPGVEIRADGSVHIRRALVLSLAAEYLDGADAPEHADVVRHVARRFPRADAAAVHYLADEVADAARASIAQVVLEHRATTAGR